jgi:aryl-alcohol dehydrogenase-like predicted oxidoreductase
MEKRRLGKTGHMSSIVALGGAAFWKISQAEAEVGIELAVQHGVNHIDVAPSYGQAQMRLGPWLEKHRKGMFVGCKTQERSKARAWEELKRSLEMLRVDYFDLYQFHGVDDYETLGAVLGPEGALEAVLEAKQQGLVKYIGITGHRPFVHVEALNRFDFDTVLFPLNRVLAAHRNDFNDFTTLLKVAQKKDVGMLAIKSITKRPWEGPTHMYQTWYEPFDEQVEIDRSLWYTLSQGVTTCPMSSDLRLWPMTIDAVERYKPMDAREQADVVAQVRRYRPLFPRP